MELSLSLGQAIAAIRACATRPLRATFAGWRPAVLRSSHAPPPLATQHHHHHPPAAPCRAAPSSDWEGMVSLSRNSLSTEFFKFLDLRIRWVARG